MKTSTSFLLFISVCIPALLQAQPSVYTITKQQNFLQTSATTVIADPVAPAYFSAATPAVATLTLPSGATKQVTLEPMDDEYRFGEVFTAKAALDAAYPTGAYRLSATGIPTLTLNMVADEYPATTPQIISTDNGTWNNNVLIVDPSRATTLTFSTFGDYGTGGSIGHVYFELSGWGDPSVEIDLEVMSQALWPELTVQPTAPTSYTIPAGTLTSGQVYVGWLNFDRILQADSTTIPGSLAGVLFTKELMFIIGAQNSGTSTPPPQIRVQPASRVGSPGASVTLNLAVDSASMAAPLQCVWKHNGTQIDGESSNSKYETSPTALTIHNLTDADAGAYTVMIFNAGGMTMSQTAMVTLDTATAPVISGQPRGATVNAGTTAVLAVSASGTPTPTYQWVKDGVPVAGATGETLVFNAVAASDAGNYSVVVTNSSGTVMSETAALVVTANQPSMLPNLSVRTSLAASQTLIVGFSTAGSKDMLVRASGPALGAFGLTGLLADPSVVLYSGSTKIDENNDWDYGLKPVADRVQAFGWTAGSKDAALLRTCNGSQTAHIGGAGGGMTLVEVYDAGGDGKLVNVSARNKVGTGADILIAGFVVDGNAAKTLLIRGVGPRLADFGVGSVLEDPKLEIYTSAGVKIAENDNWNTALEPICRSVNAFDLLANSRDAALVITLSPGVYTAQVSGVGGTTGEAVIEVYEVP